ncbi:MAG: cytochrome P450 [Dehalococcoidia bacterium]
MDLNMFDPAVMSNPYPIYASLRKQAPIVWSSALGAWMVTAYDEAVAVLQDHWAFSNQDRGCSCGAIREATLSYDLGNSAAQVLTSPTMLNTDPPDHTILRSLASKAFTPRAVTLLELRMREITEQLLPALTDGTAFDVVDVLAYPLPVIMIAEMLGIPPEDRDSFKRWSDDIISVNETSKPDDVARVRVSNQDLRRYLSGIIEERRRIPREDLISRLLEAMVGNERFGQEALVDMCILLLVSGNETTTNLISSALLALARAPAQRQKLLGDPTLLPTAVEEFLRFDGPVQIVPRIAARDVVMGDTAIAEGSMVLVMLAAADRDPARFENPDALDVTRTDNPHIAFGRGIHYCLGGPLARLEGRIALAAFLRRFPRFELASPSSPLEYGSSFVLRGLRRLDIAGYHEQRRIPARREAVLPSVFGEPCGW